MSGLQTLGVCEVLERLDRRECSSEDVVRDVLGAIGRIDSAIDGYLSVEAEDALAQARAADPPSG